MHQKPCRFRRLGGLSARLFLRLRELNFKLFMKSLFSSLFLLVLLHTAAFSQGTRLSPVANTVLETEALRFELMTKGDTAALSGLLAKDLIYLHSNGLTETKPQHLQAIAAGRLKYNTMQRGEVTVRLYGKIAITNGLLHAAGILNGNAFDIQLRYTAVYQKQRKTWRLLNWQSTRI